MNKQHSRSGLEFLVRRDVIFLSAFQIMSHKKFLCKEMIEINKSEENFSETHFVLILFINSQCFQVIKITKIYWELNTYQTLCFSNISFCLHSSTMKTHFYPKCTGRKMFKKRLGTMLSVSLLVSDGAGTHNLILIILKPLMPLTKIESVRIGFNLFH